MTTVRLSAARGFALVIVMLVIVVLGLLAGAFALSMKVESRLAANANNDAEMEWLGRSGVELARFVIANSGGGAGPTSGPGPCAPRLFCRRPKVCS